MNLLSYLGHHSHPLPPVIERGAAGNIRRNSAVIARQPPKPEAPKQYTRPGQAQIDVAARNRLAVLRAINSGCSNIMDVVEAVGVSKSGAFNHINALEEKGLVRINNRAKPFRIKITAAGQRELAK